MTATTLSAPMYRRPALRLVTADEAPVRTFNRRRRALRGLRDQILSERRYEHQFTV